MKRFTPVRTGSRRFCVWQSWRRPVHPRSHGEQTSKTPKDGARTGSPPFARGAVDVVILGHGRLRFTPVRTGSRGATQRAANTHPVHPRSHGEQARRERIADNAHGSPPFARGAARPQAPQVGTVRFTPVRTGSRSDRVTRTRGCSVHPRSHGEQWSGNSPSCRSLGSPPFARGAG